MIISVLMFLLAVSIMVFTRTDNYTVFAVMCVICSLMAAPFVIFLVFKLFPMFSKMRF